MARPAGCAIYEGERGEVPFLAEGKNKECSLSGPLSESSPAAWSTPGTRAQHMLDLPLKSV